VTFISTENSFGQKSPEVIDNILIDPEIGKPDLKAFRFSDDFWASNNDIILHQTSHLGSAFVHSEKGKAHISLDVRGTQASQYEWVIRKAPRNASLTTIYFKIQKYQITGAIEERNNQGMPTLQRELSPLELDDAPSVLSAAFGAAQIDRQAALIRNRRSNLYNELQETIMNGNNINERYGLDRFEETQINRILLSTFNSARQHDRNAALNDQIEKTGFAEALNDTFDSMSRLAG